MYFVRRLPRHSGPRNDMNKLAKLYQVLSYRLN